MNKSNLKTKGIFKTETRIDIFDGNGNRLAPTLSNTFVKIGLLDFVECFAESKHINYMIMSEDENRESDTTALDGAKLSINSSYSSRDESTGVIAIVFEMISSKDNYADISVLNSLGLMVDDRLVTVVNVGGMPLDTTDNISITYKLLISFA